MRIYLSCPMSIPEEKLEEVIKHLFNAAPDNQVRWWKRGTVYNEERFIKECDLFVVILPDAAWACTATRIPRGTRSEVELATKYQKPIGLAYWSSEGLAVYDTRLSSSTITGKPATRDRLLKLKSDEAFPDLPKAIKQITLESNVKPKQLDLFKDSDLNPAVLLLKRSA